LESLRQWVVQGHQRKEEEMKLLNDFRQLLLRGNPVGVRSDFPQ